MGCIIPITDYPVMNLGFLDTVFDDRVITESCKEQHDCQTEPELSNVFPELELVVRGQETEDIPALKVPATLLGQQHMWPSIARDIALLSIPQAGSKVVDIKAIQKEYELSDEDMAQLFKLPRFEHLLWNEMTRIQREGPALGHKYWAEGMAVRMGEDIYTNLYSNDEARVQDKLKFFELLSQQADLIPKSAKSADDGSITNNNATAQVAINIAVPEGVTNPKIAHLREVF